MYTVPLLTGGEAEEATLLLSIENNWIFQLFLMPKIYADY